MPLIFVTSYFTNSHKIKLVPISYFSQVMQRSGKVQAPGDLGKKSECRERDGKRPVVEISSVTIPEN